MSEYPRLSRPAGAAQPGIGIVHLGPGAFFRAFNAIYTQEAMAAAGGDWAVRAVSLRSPGIRDHLAPQGWAYTATALAPDGPERKIITSLADILVAPEGPGSVLDAMSDPGVRVVSLTVTEKGYCHNPATGRLRLDDPDILHDIAEPHTPCSAPGYLVAALERRRAAGSRPFTVLSCDNLPSNGALVRQVVLDFAAQRDPSLADWIAAEARFPATMVDRITPATTEEDIANLAEAEGYLDLGCVQHEPFRQWVIEEDFVDGARPAWDLAGAQLVMDVAAHETMKLRCLNGTHSALAYLGYLAGHETVADAVSDPVFAGLCRHLWKREIVPTVPPPEGEDLAAYCDALLARYRNPAIRHRTWQIAMDGSQKLPQRILGTIADNAAAGRPSPGLALVVAAWMRYVGGVDETGAQIDVRDPLADRLRTAWDSKVTGSDKVRALLAIQDVFSPDLVATPGFAEAVTDACEALLRDGARAACERLIEARST